MGILDFLRGKSAAEGEPIPINEKAEEEQAPEQLSLTEIAKKKEIAMLEKRRGKAMFFSTFALATTLLSGGTASAADEGRALIQGIFNLGGRVVTEAGATQRAHEREQTARIREDRRLEAQRLREQTNQMREEARLEREKHRDDTAVQRERIHGDTTIGREHEHTEQVRIREGSNVQRTEIKEEEASRRRLADKGVVEAGGKVSSKGPFDYSRERSSDNVSRKQMEGGVAVSQMPESEPHGGREYGSESMTEARRNELSQMAVDDYKEGLPRGEFKTMPEAERQVYGHAWNSLEHNLGRTDILLRSGR